MTVQEWIAQIDEFRKTDGTLADGAWHGYLNDGSPVLRGRYILARWERPNVVISDDDPEALLENARILENALQAAD